MDILEGYVDREALAAGFGVSTRTIARWMAQPDGLPYTAIGGKVLFRSQAVREWLLRRERRPNARRAA
jgi:phage terminase Nu1 subunit (DNA packaging protein)